MQKLSHLINNAVRWLRTISLPKSLNLPLDEIAKVLCYGDSNTWGYVPLTGKRHSFGSRWPGIIQKRLGRNVRVIEEGLSGRTTAWDDPLADGRNGKKSIKVILKSHAPIDLVVIMLGTNDLKERFGLSAYEISQGAGSLVQMTKESSAGPKDSSPQVLLVTPPRVNFLADRTSLDFKGAIEKSRELSIQYESVAKKLGCAYFDASESVAFSQIDGVHLDEEGHWKLGAALGKIIKNLLLAKT
jgi:lysophospholipase L1-like esterase